MSTLPNPATFIGLADRTIVAQINELEKNFLMGTITADVLRKELTTFYNDAGDPDVKKWILMEYDGLEYGAKRRVT